MNQSYDIIGVDYANLRRPDPRISARIRHALGSADHVLNVGAGAGSYEPEDCVVTALEPSREMIRQRPAGKAMVVRARAENLPFADRSFDASMAILTIHHWRDQAKGLHEMRRVTRDRIVILTYDATFRNFWLADYLPGLVQLDEAQMPPMDFYARALGPVTIHPVPIPHDCEDGFLCAYWRRPRAYLDAKIRAAMSSFWALGDVSGALAALADDLESGAWEQRYGHLMSEAERDFGYRLIVTD